MRRVGFRRLCPVREGWGGSGLEAGPGQRTDPCAGFSRGSSSGNLLQRSRPAPRGGRGHSHFKTPDGHPGTPTRRVGTVAA